MTLPDEDPSQNHFSGTESLDRLRSLLPGPLARPSTPDVASLPTTTVARQRASSVAASLDQDEHLSEKIAEQQEHGADVTGLVAEKGTVLYLAYGSNLASKTFRGVRGIKPLSQINVLVPELRLTFDLPGIPYAEPCFAGTQFRDPEEAEDEAWDVLDNSSVSEKVPLVAATDAHRNRWHKPLVGVVYEVTLTDYAKIIATEGGGRGYRDVVVDCHAFPESYKPADPVPEHPGTPAFKVHTLLSPAADEERQRKQSGITHTHAPQNSSGLSALFKSEPHLRPDPEYAQPSARYLNLLTTGAAEHQLPIAYQAYLAQIRPYRITSTRQKIGKVVFLAMWGPPVLAILALSKLFAGPDGRSPPWIVTLANLVFEAVWRSYDMVFVKLFGDGERTVEPDDTL
ncbi:hypothetical protein N7474_006021 [Penicillium riverlandense]|uniref:uncharacterized protein n=1 Tax=Penicillium riverlandense TaxID=1903569 RepID=UPI002546B5CD|nr:uncharacterized protein N7474_006021 [Penicillium riverlandense]KAJ5820430.1 hypothetical protein N7474_006021 [Penicillium riverlandense]